MSDDGPPGAMDGELDIWLDVQRTDEGISVTVYSQAPGEEPVVEDETYFTVAELWEATDE